MAHQDGVAYAAAGEDPAKVRRQLLQGQRGCSARGAAMAPKVRGDHPDPGAQEARGHGVPVVQAAAPAVDQDRCTGSGGVRLSGCGVPARR